MMLILLRATEMRARPTRGHARRGRNCLLGGGLHMACEPFGDFGLYQSPEGNHDDRAVVK
jgi:hypothetical protein